MQISNVTLQNGVIVKALSHHQACTQKSDVLISLSIIQIFLRSGGTLNEIHIWMNFDWGGLLLNDHSECVSFMNFVIMSGVNNVPIGFFKSVMSSRKKRNLMYVPPPTK